VFKNSNTIKCLQKKESFLKASTEWEWDMCCLILHFVLGFTLKYNSLTLHGRSRFSGRWHIIVRSNRKVRDQFHLHCMSRFFPTIFRLIILFALLHLWVVEIDTSAQIHQHSTYSFYMRRSQKCTKRQSSCQSFLCLQDQWA